MTGAPGAYPTELEREETLKDGARVRIRPIRPEDEPRLIEFYGRLSPYTAYQRFFTAMKRLPPDWAHFLTNVDYRRRLALVVEREAPAGPELIAVGRYEPSSPEDTAEVAFAVQDSWQNRGLATLLCAIFSTPPRRAASGVSAPMCWLITTGCSTSLPVSRKSSRARRRRE